MDGYEIIEHTADVGISARARDVGAAFRQTTLGLLDVMGARCDEDGRGEQVAVELEAGDLEGLLIDWLNEVIWVQESHGGRISDVGTAVDEKATRLNATLKVHDGAPPPDGTAVKAATFHQIRVAEEGPEVSVRVYLDV
ncbi:MAG: archease [Actinomycetota bacterium]